MGLNFGGLGFEFEATDSSAEKIAGGVSDAVSDLWDNLKKTAPMVGKAGRAMSTGFSKMRSVGSKVMGGLALATASAIEQATDPKLSSSIDQMMAGFHKSFSAMTVGMDMTSKEAKKMEGVIGSAAYSLNEDMDGASKAWAAFRKQNVDLAKVLGSKGTEGAIKDLIKVTSVYETEGEQLANLFAGHIKGFGFTEERVGSLADKIVYLGKKFNIGREAIQSWPATFDVLNKELADFGRNATPEDIEKFTTSIVGLGAGLKESLGVSGQEGIDMARNALTVLLGERKNIINMFRGTGGEIGAFTERMIESGTGIQGAMKMLESDPLVVMDMIAKMGGKIQQETGTMSAAFQRFSQGVNEALGPGMTFAMKGNWDTVREAVSKIPEYLASPQAKGAFTDFARHAHSTGRSMQDQWEFMLENMRHRLMSIAKPLKREWVKTMTGGFQTTIKAIETLAKEDGPAGELTRRLLLVKDVGLSGLIPELGKLAPLFGGALTALVPFMTAFGAMGLKFRDVGKMALAGGAVYVLFKVLREGPEKAWESFKELGDSLLKFADTIFPGIRKQVKDFFGDIEGGPAEGIGKLFRNLGQKIGTFLRNVDWAKVGKTVAGLTMEVFAIVGESIGGFFAGLFSADKIEKEAADPLKAGFSNVLTTALFAAVQGSGGIIKGVFQKFWDYMFSADSVGDLVGRVLKMATGVLLPVFGLAMAKGFKSIALGGNFLAGFKGVFSTFGKVAKIFGPTFIAVRFFIELLGQVKSKMEDIDTVMKSKLVPEMSKTAVAGELAFTGILESIDSALFGLPSMIGKSFGLSKNEISAFYQWMVTSFEQTMALVHWVVDSGVRKITTAWDMFPKSVKAGFDVVLSTASYATSFIAGAFKKLVLNVEGWFDGLVSSFEKIWMDIRHTVEEQMENILVWASELIVKANEIADLLVPDEFAKVAKQYLDEYKKAGGERGAQKRREDEKKAFEEKSVAREDARQQEAKAIDTEVERKLSMLKTSADDFVKVFDQWGAKNEKQQRMADMHLQERMKSIDEDYDRNVEASRMARAEIEDRKAVVEAETVEEKKGGKKGRGVKGKAVPPTVEERAATEWWAKAPQAAPAPAAMAPSEDLKAIRKYLEKPAPVPVIVTVKGDRKVKSLLDITTGSASSGVVPGL